MENLLDFNEQCLDDTIGTKEDRVQEDAEERREIWANDKHPQIAPHFGGVAQDRSAQTSRWIDRRTTDGNEREMRHHHGHADCHRTANGRGAAVLGILRPSRGVGHILIRRKAK